MKIPSSLRLLSLILTISSAFAVAQTYTMTDLGVLKSGGYSVGRGINASAQVTGAAGVLNSPGADVFTYHNGALTSLGTLGGNTGIGNAINATGQIAGYSTDSSGTYRAFISNGKKLTDIGDLGGGSAVAYFINDAGNVVGSAVTSDGGNHPFLYSAGHMTDLGTLGSPEGTNWWNSAQGINNSDAVAGTSYDSQGNFFGFVWQNGKMTKIGTLGGPWSQAYAINNKGQVAGIAYTKAGDAHAYLMTNGKLKDLGVLGGKFGTSWGFALNDSGVVVGQATFNNFVGYVAFVYSGGKIKDLNTLVPKGSGWTLYEARGINNAGQIVCSGMKSNGTQHALLLTPQ